ncbi:MAG: peptide deformylase [Candidatus Lambdaproteobacteria bacterium RIFOXYD1_FULL_56_27]|uniref:Peptide deformylase n=1 Tax=Candidatus Lambdaproteobacteria bacterium RIFOXYD2_FULL_56_26 TaxID=1817773 RepID=A0A1F6GMC3_9PROT|nr:MAG: peptide deformylase [Candidatus Lambdaproteobacteria bacterium RIFOXYD2_FULL_56_26]OGH01793.1 MAG: peptide deformylase [Candidatus Lambdaproteobacteria bacterium RIFOXYC1_FULL_56_13]OGH07943.1 MAG: peptide deformylase [Candidatus Lambdaproteobacteria bacterium RIFOXYD1_FULL_56_27]
MEKLKILTYPDPFLKQKAQQVTKFDDSLKELAQAMAAAMYDNTGIGLAAPQVGHGLRLFVADVDFHGEDSGPKNPIAYCNPVIKNGQGRGMNEEGCLSVPEYRAEVERFERLTLEYQDLDGNQHSLEAEGLLAICIQHETDHLEGKLFIDYLPPLKRKMVQNRLKKLAREA